MKRKGRTFKAIGKTLAISYIGIIVFWAVCIIVLFITMSNDKCTWFNDKKYDTIQELHKDYKDTCYTIGDIAYVPDEIILSHRVDDYVFVFCTTVCKRSVMQDQYLTVYIVRVIDNQYVLEVPYYGIEVIPTAYLPKHNNLETLECDWMEYVTEKEKICIGVAYKEVDNNNSLFFDGIKMTEIICTDPFTHKDFILCYAISDVTYNVVESLFVPIDERHTFEIR